MEHAPAAKPASALPAARPRTRRVLRPRVRSRAVANGLFKGLTLQLFKGPIQSAVGFTANDYAKRILLRWRDRGR